MSGSRPAPGTTLAIARWEEIAQGHRRSAQALLDLAEAAEQQARREREAYIAQQEADRELVARPRRRRVA